MSSKSPLSFSPAQFLGLNAPTYITPSEFTVGDYTLRIDNAASIDFKDQEFHPPLIEESAEDVRVPLNVILQSFSAAKVESPELVPQVFQAWTSGWFAVTVRNKVSPDEGVRHFVVQTTEDSINQFCSMLLSHVGTISTLTSGDTWINIGHDDRRGTHYGDLVVELDQAVPESVHVCKRRLGLLIRAEHLNNLNDLKRKSTDALSRLGFQLRCPGITLAYGLHPSASNWLRYIERTEFATMDFNNDYAFNSRGVETITRFSFREVVNKISIPIVVTDNEDELEQEDDYIGIINKEIDSAALTFQAFLDHLKGFHERYVDRKEG